MSHDNFDHISWRQTFSELQMDRDIEARVVASFVLEGDSDLAADAARKYAMLSDLVRAHIALLPDTIRGKDAN